MLAFFLNLLFPPRSLTNVPGVWITDDERSAMEIWPIFLDTDALREQGITYIDEMASACRYDASPLMRTAILRLKYRGVRVLGEELGDILAGTIGLLTATRDSRFCPVPLHWIREFARGFNQSAMLAQFVSANTGIAIAPCLSRARSTGHQARRSREKRLHAMTNAFAVQGNTLPVHVILVDDVSTTGATLDACAKVLKDAGVERVDALVVALG